ncbi:sensor domain-containing diguanylate cyclase [Paenibacillus sp. PsM32]|uniref:Sensor domain-containing diguanylate cyclase n=2 Tax=Paenibacillus TaxID=44249 RepID=A0AAX3LVN0_9BACL|nr:MULTISPECIES: sensor domain-containing diguanylate cyclase [Paenibacillus]MDN4618256.1 sensor domain-containing diguanylate cyclase [Paenibacillus sp. PsM32]MDQ1234277.1 diguanylate cyclase (GGDEF)-like protein [Paenibacillus sp. SORGH_AS_0306]MDR6111321.1 diguanylate cyclase (GGDEF)-like protein [Paenibacillus sp. SORGH_AS_0338]WCT53892.1 sensor domain-containing diguanylate cyclase [Paenibacillus kyungheensis]
MRLYPKKGFRLVTIVSTIIVFSILLTMIISIYSAYIVSKQALINNYLDNNYQHATELANAAGNILGTMQESIDALATIWQRENKIDQDLLEDLYTNNKNYFNSIVIVNKDLIVNNTVPATSGVKAGQQLSGPINNTLLEIQIPHITEPFMSKDGRWIVLVTSPLFDKQERYYGYIAGTIYLQKSNVLQGILEQDYSSDGSYVYAVGPKGNIIFHPNLKLVGSNKAADEAVWKVMAGLAGKIEFTDQQNQTFYTGYAYNMKSSWGVIVQTPASVISVPLRELLQKSILLSLPLLLITLAAGWIITYLAVRPLQVLADYSNRMVDDWKSEALPPIRSGTYEVKVLYQSIRFTTRQLQKYIVKLKNETALDGLTGLANRRNFDSTLETWCIGDEPFAMVMLDIDHFKRVNDTYGHLTGDRVMQFLAVTMRNVSREGDVCFRYGGEEFGILLRGCNVTRAYIVAERLRELLHGTVSPSGELITVSSGVVAFPEHGKTPNDLISHADEAMYTSKREGRNRTTIYQKEITKADNQNEVKSAEEINV